MGRAARPLSHAALTETPNGYFWDGERVYRMAAAGLAQLESEIAKMSHRAARLGVAAPTLRTVHQGLQPELSLTRRAQTWFYVLPPGAAPVLAGGKFLGVPEHAGAEIGTPGNTIFAGRSQSV